MFIQFKMQVRLDPDIAKLVKRSADAHQRVFKRRRSFSAHVNLLLRDALFHGKDGKNSMKVVTRIFGDWGSVPIKQKK